MKLGILLSLVCLLGAVAQAQSSCPAAGMTQVASGLTAVTFTDTAVSDGQTYFYQVSANNQFGAACTPVSAAVVIPGTGTHSVTLAWTASTTSGVTYAVFRASPPAPPTGLTATVN